ncbi:berberine/berberine-like, FAD-binding, type 2 [Artemisia annua]|uniref:Berberine/berberine-like, FAD-binding, type 2 n=1 Tax=Artemisia annua TaxID=35608 RepID=A0A2U1NZX8_ARTAN|nr:berberine/berberine-like, FAD-binding, type 2 [Artemisia annua]
MNAPDTVFNPNSTQFASTLQLTAVNLRLSTPTTPKAVSYNHPFDICTCTICIESEHEVVDMTMLEYHNIIYFIKSSFVVLDLKQLRTININPAKKTAWVDSGATVEPIPKEKVPKIWKWFLEDDSPLLIMDPYGGMMDKIQETSIPHSHRKWDLDLGQNKNANATIFSEALKWGNQYYGNNFKRLAMVKVVVDPQHFFYHEQSIPPQKA